MAEDFLEHRVHQLPSLGLGVSTEFGAFGKPDSLDIRLLRSRYPQYAQFLEIGVEVRRGLDEDTRQWVASGGRTTYHFLDLNLSAPDRLEPRHLEEIKVLAEAVDAAWVCGDAGLWYFGQPHPLHMTLLPPVLTEDSAQLYAESIVRCRNVLGKEVLPENPPGTVFAGDLDLLRFYQLVCEQADSGMLLDAAHLGIYQSICGRAPLEGLSDFPLDRIVELHVAGSTVQMIDGLKIWTDDHHPTVRPETWTIAQYVMDHAPNLKAVVFECERNPLEDCVDGFERLAHMLAQRTAI
jgi:uncharacterized protein